MTPNEIEKLAEQIWSKVQELNGQYVRKELCQERSGTITTRITYLYWILGVVIVGLMLNLLLPK